MHACWRIDDAWGAAGGADEGLKELSRSSMTVLKERHFVAVDARRSKDCLAVMEAAIMQSTQAVCGGVASSRGLKVEGRGVNCQLCWILMIANLGLVGHSEEEPADVLRNIIALYISLLQLVHYWMIEVHCQGSRDCAHTESQTNTDLTRKQAGLRSQSYKEL